MTNTQDSNSTRNSRGSSSGSKVNDDSVDAMGQKTVFDKFIHVAQDQYYTIRDWLQDNIFLTRKWFIFFPFLQALIFPAGYLILLNAAIHLTLPSVNYFNLVHIALFLLCERTIHSITLVFDQINTFENSWSLVFHHTTFKNLSAHKKSDSYLDILVRILLLTFLICNLATTYFAEWSQVGQFGSYLGNFDCISPTYLNETLESFTVNGDVISGDIDFAQIYAYGLPLADGVIAGFSPWPTADPLPYYTIIGEGPLLAMKVDCSSIPEPFVGLNQTYSGSGSMISEIFIQDNTFRMTMEVILPAVGFHPNNSDIASDWVSFPCLVQGVATRGDWYFSYRVDEWQMVTNGLALKLNIGNFPSIEQRSSNAYFSDEVLTYIRENFDPTEESISIIRNFVRSLYVIFDDKWYAPSQGGTFSNIMSWATLPDGYYYPDLVYRGLSSALGSVTHQLYLQFDPSILGKCEYWGKDGSGKMSLEGPWVITVDIVLGITLCCTYTKILLVYLDSPLRNFELMKEGLRLTKNEGYRLLNMMGWLSNLHKSHSIIGNIDKAQEIFEKTEIRYGHKKAHFSNEPMIGPLNDVSHFKLSNFSKLKEAQVKEVEEVIEEEEEEEEDQDAIPPLSPRFGRPRVISEGQPISSGVLLTNSKLSRTIGALKPFREDHEKSNIK